jgi:hypothetical protein
MFMKIDVRCNEKKRTLDLLKEAGQNICPGRGCEPLEIGLPRFLRKSLV